MLNFSTDLATGFRLANNTDIVTAARMVFESYSPYIPIIGKIPPTIFEDFGKHIRSNNLWFVEIKNSAAGMVVLTPFDNYILLQSMCVLPEFQGRGLGRLLLTFGEALAIKSKYTKIHLYTNSLMERNQEIYKKNGYSEVYRVPYEWGWRVHMEKTLAIEYTRLQDFAHTFG